jgi:hypothetical protein
VLAQIRTEADRPLEDPAGISFTPAYYTMHGRTEGFAATLGDGEITPEHVLLALLWDPASSSTELLWRLGVQREAIIKRLRALGVAVPAAALPPTREIEMGERVWFEREQTARVLEHLRHSIPPDTLWGFNYEDDRAWVDAESRVDLGALVAAALS